jgi:hypothetical protein
MISYMRNKRREERKRSDAIAERRYAAKNSKIRKSISLLLAILLGLTIGLLFSGCQSKQPEASISLLDIKPSKIYTTINDMTFDADIIVQVKVDSVITTKEEEMITTHSVVKVLRSYKGQATQGDELLVIEPGGVLEQANQKIDYRPDGIAVIAKGQSYILFLELVSDAEARWTCAILGIYQGKFLIDQNMISQQAPEDARLSETWPQVTLVFATKIVAAVISQKVLSTDTQP